MTSLVILPGLDGTARQHTEFLAIAKPHFSQITVVEYPTHTCLNYAQLEEFARAQLPEGSFVLIGESFSGPIALSIAAAPPQGLDAVVLAASFAQTPLPLLSRLAPLVKRAPNRWIPTQWLSIWLLGHYATAPRHQRLQDALALVSPEVLSFRAALALAARPKITKPITIPLLYLEATEDWLMPTAAARMVKKVVPHMMHQKVKGPHFLLQCAPEACMTRIIEFMQAHGLQA